MIFILELFKKVAESYLKQGKAPDFIISLLKLNTRFLFSELPLQQLPVVKAPALPNTRSRFAAFLTDYIRRHSLHHMLLKDTNVVWVSNSITPSDVNMFRFTTYFIQLIGRTYKWPVQKENYQRAHTLCVFKIDANNRNTFPTCVCETALLQIGRLL